MVDIRHSPSWDQSLRADPEEEAKRGWRDDVASVLENGQFGG
jgi:hypothetical protein